MTGATPSFTQLLDWVEDRLDAEESARIAGLVLDGPAELAEQVAWIRAFLDSAAHMPLKAPPGELSDRLRGLFPRINNPRSAAGWSEASLIFDGREPAAAAGVRSAASGLSFGFDSALGRFVVEVTPPKGGLVDISGLILSARRDRSEGSASAGGIEISVRQAGSLRVTRCDSVGRFELADVPDDVDEIWLTRGEERVRAALDVHGGPGV